MRENLFAKRIEITIELQGWNNFWQFLSQAIITNNQGNHPKELARYLMVATQSFFIYTPKIGEIFFLMGWFNHQPRYFMNSGHQPFYQWGKDPEVILKEYLKGEEPRPTVWDCDLKVRDLIQRAWHVNREERPTAEEKSCDKKNSPKSPHPKSKA